MDQLIAVSRSIERKIADEHRTGAPVRLIYNGVDLQRYEHQDPCCTLRDEYGMEPGSPIVGVVARLEPEKGHQTLIEAWPHLLREVPEAYLRIVGEGSRRGNPVGLAAAVVRLLKDHAFADTIAKAGHDLVHDRFCIELMVKAIEEIYDEGARAVRLSESAAS